MEEREKLEEENERVEEELSKSKGKKEEEEEDKEEGETSKNETEKRVLSDEEIDERCESLRRKLLQELDEETNAPSDSRRDNRARRAPPKEKKQFKAYQVHELAEAKIEESERLRKALGIREDRETGEISSGWRDGRDSRR